MAFMATREPKSQEPGRSTWLLRRTDQLAVAVFVVLGLAATATWSPLTEAAVSSAASLGKDAN